MQQELKKKETTLLPHLQDQEGYLEEKDIYFNTSHLNQVKS